MLRLAGQPERLPRPRRVIRRIELQAARLAKASRQIEQETTAVWRDAASSDEVIGKPLAAARREIVVTNATAARARVNDAVASSVNRDMADAVAVLEHHEVTR